MPQTFTPIHTFNLASSARVVTTQPCTSCGRNHRAQRIGIVMTMGRVTPPTINCGA